MKKKIKKFLVKGNICNQDNRKNAGITLVALVITIVLLIILASVAINLSLGNNGIFNKAKTAKEQYQNAREYEYEQIESIDETINEYDITSGRSEQLNYDMIPSAVIERGCNANNTKINITKGKYKSFILSSMYYKSSSVNASDKGLINSENATCTQIVCSKEGENENSTKQVFRLYLIKADNDFSITISSCDTWCICGLEKDVEINKIIEQASASDPGGTETIVSNNDYEYLILGTSYWSGGSAINTNGYAFMQCDMHLYKTIMESTRSSTSNQTDAQDENSNYAVQRIFLIKNNQESARIRFSNKVDCYYICGLNEK